MMFLRKAKETAAVANLLMKAEIVRGTKNLKIFSNGRDNCFCLRGGSTNENRHPIWKDSGKNLNYFLWFLV